MSGSWLTPIAWIVFITGKAGIPAGKIMRFAMIVSGETAADVFSQGMTGININQPSGKRDPVHGFPAH